LGQIDTATFTTVTTTTTPWLTTASYFSGGTKKAGEFGATNVSTT